MKMLGDREYMEMAVGQAEMCLSSDAAYSVGAVIVTADGDVFMGFSRESGPLNHAEEEAVAKAEAAGAELRGATMYSTMEPCTHRKSKPVSCTELILVRGFSKVAYAVGEPPHLAVCTGIQTLSEAGVETIRIEGFEARLEAVNAHITGR